MHTTLGESTRLTSDESTRLTSDESIRTTSDEGRYTTGEIAKICGVTVRTVQYYDKRSILIPSDLSEGGRRL